MTIPERNLNPPKDDWIECPDCEGRRWIFVALGYWRWCPRCDGDGVIDKREVQKELDAAQADKAHDAKMEEEDE